MGSDDFGVDTDAIDSTCGEPPVGADGPTDAVCGNEAVTFVFRTAGHRAYICQDHAEMLLRFGDDVFEDGQPTVIRCKRCLRPTAKRHANHDKICADCQT